MNSFLSKFLLTVLLFGFCCSSVRADESSKQAKIQELFTVMQMSKTFDNMVDQGAAQGANAAMSLFPNVKLTPAQQKVMDSKLDEIRKVLHDTLSWQKLEPDIAKVYAENYSEATLDGLLSFYKSPAGQDMLAKQATVMAQSGAVVQHVSVAMQPRLQEIMKSLAEDMKKASPAGK